VKHIRNGKAGTDAQGAVQDPVGTPDTSTPPGTNAGDPGAATTAPNAAGGGANAGTTPGTTPGTNNSNTGNTGNTSNPAGGLDDVRFSQRQVNGFMAAAKAEAKREIEQAAQAAADKAAKEEAEKQGNYKAVLEAERAERVTEQAELKTLRERVATYEAAEMKRLDEELARWPESVRKLDPGTQDPGARMKWADAHRELAEELLGVGGAHPPGNPPNPKPAGGSGQAALFEQTKREMESSGRYNAI
jgi:hypothetical protein